MNRSPFLFASLLLATAALFVVVGAALGAGAHSLVGTLGRNKETVEAKIEN